MKRNKLKLKNYLTMSGFALVAAATSFTSAPKAQAEEVNGETTNVVANKATANTQGNILLQTSSATDESSLVAAPETTSKQDVAVPYVEPQLTTPQSGDVKDGDAYFDFDGLGNRHFLDVDYYNLMQAKQAPGTLTIKASNTQPHAYFTDQTYGQVTASRGGKVLYDQAFIGNKSQPVDDKVMLQPGDMLKIFHAEPDRLHTANDAVMKQTNVERLTDYYYQVAQDFSLKNISEYIYLDKKAHNLFGNAKRSQLAFGIQQADIDDLKVIVQQSGKMLSATEKKSIQATLDQAQKLMNQAGGTIPAKKVMKKTFFNIPVATSIQATNKEGRRMGSNHDRQALGVVLYDGAKIRVRQVNKNFKDQVTVQLIGDNSKKIVSQKIGQNWVELKANGPQAAFMLTPLTDSKVSAQLEYEVVSGTVKDLPVFTAKANNEKVKQTWNDNRVPFALIEANNIQILVPAYDMDTVESLNIKKLIDQYDNQIFKMFDDLTGMPTNTVFEAPVKGRYFAFADQQGAGAAYYASSYTAQNSKSVAAYLTTNWLPLHEIAHGYEIPSESMYLVDSMNNIYATLYQAKYNEDFLSSSWIFGGKKDEVAKTALKAALDDRQTWAEMGYRERLVFWMDIAANLVGEDAFKQFNTYHRQLANADDKNVNDIAKVWIEMYANKYKLNVAPFFDILQVPTNEVTIKDVYNKYSAVALLAQVVPKQKLPEAIKKLGWDKQLLQSQASLVTNAQIAKLGYKSNVKLNLVNADKMKGKTLSLMDGSKVIKTVTVKGTSVDFGEIANGVYTLKSSDSNLILEEMYLYVKENETHTMTVRANASVLKVVSGLFADDQLKQLSSNLNLDTIRKAQAAVDIIKDKTLKQKNQALIEVAQKSLTQITPNGFGGEFMTIRYFGNEGILRITTKARQPHALRGNEDYVTITVTSRDNKQKYRRVIKATEQLQAQDYSINLEASDKIEITTLDGFQDFYSNGLAKKDKFSTVMYVGNDKYLTATKPVDLEVINNQRITDVMKLRQMIISAQANKRPLPEVAVTLPKPTAKVKSIREKQIEKLMNLQTDDPKFQDVLKQILQKK